MARARRRLRTSSTGRSGRWRGALPGCLAALLVSCLSAGSPVDRIRERLVGVSARSLRGCVGVPYDTSVDGDTEYLVYRWLDVPRDEEYPELDPLPGGPRELPDRAVPRGPADILDPTRGSDRDRRPSPSVPDARSRVGIGYCELVFEVEGGKVRHVEVDSRRPSGLRDDLECIYRARSCAEPPAS